jgi:hypothetical protein
MLSHSYGSFVELMDGTHCMLLARAVFNIIYGMDKQYDEVYFLAGMCCSCLIDYYVCFFPSFMVNLSAVQLCNYSFQCYPEVRSLKY